MVLSHAALSTLRAMLDRLIPADEFPGALETRVEDYILRQLAGDCAAEAATLSDGLAQLELESQARFSGAAFGARSPDEQDALLHDLESGRTVTAWPSARRAEEFLRRMVELAHEGFYADPANRGNAHAASWRMIGYDPHIPGWPESSRSEADCRPSS